MNLSVNVCPPPLIVTNISENWFDGNEGCGFPCGNPLYSSSEIHKYRIFIAVLASICFTCTSFTVLTFLIDWHHYNRYPGFILFYINLCFVVGSIGWLAQFVGNFRDHILCRPDNTLRRSAVTIGVEDSAFCIIIFLLVYYSLLAGMTWFVILSHAWYISFRQLQTCQSRLQGKKEHYHLISWSVPFILTALAIVTTDIDAEHLDGICFVGEQESLSQTIFVLGPAGVSLVTAFLYMFKGVLSLMKLKRDSSIVSSHLINSKIRTTMIRLGVVSLLAFILVCIIFGTYLHSYVNDHGLKYTFKEKIKCEKLLMNKGITNSTNCKVTDYPVIGILKLKAFTYFGLGLVMSSWSWNNTTLKSWRQLYFRVSGKQPNGTGTETAFVTTIRNTERHLSISSNRQ